MEEDMGVRRKTSGEGQMRRMQRWIVILLCFIIGTGHLSEEVQAKKKKPLKDYSTTSYDWGLHLNKQHKKPGGSGPYGWKLKKDAAYYIGKHSRKDQVVYLTFDCGYEAGFTKKILDTLKKNDVKALFFVTKPYITQNPGIVKRMKKEGHLVGNHTSTHPRMAKLSVQRIQKEIQDCEKEMKKRTGYEMDRFLRPPEGNFSIRSVNTAQRMGYATIFWSLAYYDYDTANQPGAGYVLGKFRTYHHNGMIPLIHTCSRSNTEALGSVIRMLEKKGYRFGSLDEFIL